MVRLRWRRWLLAGLFTFLFVVIYRANDSGEMDSEKLDILREMQVYDNFAKLSQEYQKHKIEDHKTELIEKSNDVREFIRDAAKQVKQDVEKLRILLPGKDTDKESVKDIQEEPAKAIHKKLHEESGKLNSVQNVVNKVRADNLPDDVLSMIPKKYLSNFKNPCWYEGNSTVRRLRCLPYFQLIGVDKSGTTDLWFRLIQHPEVLQLNGVIGKETHWWSWRRFGFDIWIRNLKVWSYDQYLQAFDKPAQTILSKVQTADNMHDYHPVITGEGSPTVFWDFTGWDMIPQNKDVKPEDAYLTPHCIHHLTPEAKLIIIFRNPTERLYSDYLFLQQFRGTHESVTAETFNYAVIESMKMLEDCKATHTIKSCLYNKTLHMHMPSRIMVGMYAVYLKEWLKVFPKEQILILRNEDYSKDILGHITKVYNYLELKELPSQDVERIAKLKRQFTRSDKDRSAGPMWNQTRATLNLFYKQANQELATLLADDIFLWNDQI